MTLPCIGAGITVIDPGKKQPDIYSRGRGNGRPRRFVSSGGRGAGRFLKAYVTEVNEHRYTSSEEVRYSIVWKCGPRTGEVYAHNEGTSWVPGHGPQAKAALLAMRAMNR